MDADQGVAVAALVEERQFELQRGAPVALGHHHGARAQDRHQRARQLRSEARSPGGMGDRGRPDRIDARLCVRARGTSQRVACDDLGRRSEGSRGCAGSPRSPPREESTSVAAAAPRDSASIASAPEPANRSSTRAPVRRPRIENRASRTRSLVGRVPRPAGRCSVRPPARAGDHPHGLTTVANDHGVTPGSARRLGARTPPRAPRPAARARRGEVADPARRSARRAARARSSSSRVARAARRPGTGRGRCWRVPTSSPSPRSSRSISARREAVAVRGQRLQPRRVLRRRTAGTARRCSPRPIRPRSWCSCEIP